VYPAIHVRPKKFQSDQIAAVKLSRQLANDIDDPKIWSVGLQGFFCEPVHGLGVIGVPENWMEGPEPEPGDSNKSDKRNNFVVVGGPPTIDAVEREVKAIADSL
jgi:hypothetical protein